VKLKFEKIQQDWFPRIIREFDEGPDEKPMYYGVE